DDFYAGVAARHERPTHVEPEKKIQIPRELPATKLRVYEDKRKRSFRAKVLAVEGEAVVLDQTYFYPEGGGQEADHGTIADREVYDVQKMGTSILHFIRGDATSLLKKRVACVIDGERREALMRNHTATHIVLGDERCLVDQNPPIHAHSGRRRASGVRRGERGPRGQPQANGRPAARRRNPGGSRGSNRPHRGANHGRVEGAPQGRAEGDR